MEINKQKNLLCIIVLTWHYFLGSLLFYSTVIKASTNIRLVWTLSFLRLTPVVSTNPLNTPSEIDICVGIPATGVFKCWHFSYFVEVSRSRGDVGTASLSFKIQAFKVKRSRTKEYRLKYRRYWEEKIVHEVRTKKLKELHHSHFVLPFIITHTHARARTHTHILFLDSFSSTHIPFTVKKYLAFTNAAPRSQTCSSF